MRPSGAERCRASFGSTWSFRRSTWPPPHHAIHLRTSDGAMRFRVVRRCRLRLYKLAHLPPPRLGSKIDPVDDLVPQSLSASDPLFDEITVETLRERSVGRKRRERSDGVEPFRCAFQP